MARTREERMRRSGRSVQLSWLWLLVGAAGAVLAVVGDWWGALLLLLMASLAFAARVLDDRSAEREGVEHAPGPNDSRAASDQVDPRPAGLEATIGGRTLTDALEAYARRLDAHDVRIRVHGAARGLEPHAATQVYRVGIEAMTSALRHAHADVIDVAVDTDEERLRLLVTDNGARRAHLAQDEVRVIGAMRARARTLGGRLELAHGPSGRGTALLLDVPRVPQPPPG